MKAMVMAAGLGTRLRPLTDFLPKPIMPVANRPVLHHLLNLLHRHDVREVGINVHAFPEMIEKYFGDGSSLDMSIRWSHERDLLGTAGGTKKLQDFWGDETILVTSGDGLHDIDVTALLGHHRRTGALATLTVKPVTDPSAYGVVILVTVVCVLAFTSAKWYVGLLAGAAISVALNVVVVRRDRSLLTRQRRRR